MTAQEQPSRLRAFFAPVDVTSLVFFRIAFGLLMAHHVWSEYTDYGGFQYWFVDPAFHFSYYGFGWIKPLPEAVQHGLFVIQGLACLGIAVGFAYRLCATANFFIANYYFLLEKSLFLNHGYLISLISFLVIFLPLHQSHALDVRLGFTKHRDTAPAWVLWLLRFQIGIVYFYGGLAKINGDWLRGEPMRTYLADWEGRPWIGAFADSEPAVFFFSAGGLLLDLFIVPALLWRPTRIPAYFAIATFHLMNAWLFYIAIFPWFMLAATTIFFPPDWPRRILRRTEPEGAPLHTPVRPVIVMFVAVWVIIQLIVPLRHHLYPGDASWTEEGHHFAWRMMLRHKEVQPRFAWFIATDPASGVTQTINPFEYMAPHEAATLFARPTAMEAFAQQIIAANQAEGAEPVKVVAELRPIQFTLHDPASGESWHENVAETLAPWQREIMAIDPDLILQFAHHLALREKATRGHPIQVRAEVWASLHGRPYQPLVDPGANLADAPRNLSFKNWIVPLNGTISPE